jgi:hypothetical protein
MMRLKPAIVAGFLYSIHGIAAMRQGEFILPRIQAGINNRYFYIQGGENMFNHEAETFMKAIGIREREIWKYAETVTGFIEKNPVGSLAVEKILNDMEDLNRGSKIKLIVAALTYQYIKDMSDNSHVYDAMAKFDKTILEKMTEHADELVDESLMDIIKKMKKKGKK